MSKLEDRERRRTSVIGSIVEGAQAQAKRGRPKEDREIKTRVSLTIMPSLYDDMRKIAYVQRRSVSDIVSEQLLKYREECGVELREYEKIRKKAEGI